MTDHLDATKKRVRDAVTLFEHKEGSKHVDLKEIPTLVRSLGINPTVAQTTTISDQLSQLIAGNTENSLAFNGYVPMENIESVVANFLIQQETSLFRDDYHTLIRAFRAFDPEGKGFILAEQMKSALQTKGESLSDDELNRMVGFAADEDDKIYYEDYCQKLTDDGRHI